MMMARSAEAALLAIDLTIGRRAVSGTEAVVTFDKAFTLFTQVTRHSLRTGPVSTAAADEATWWRADSAHGLFAYRAQGALTACSSFTSGNTLFPVYLHGIVELVLMRNGSGRTRSSSSGTSAGGLRR